MQSPKFWIISKREIRDSVSDWRIVIPIVLLTLFFPWVLLIAAQVGLSKLAAFVPGNEHVIYDNFMSFAVLAAGFFPISFCLIIALESFVGEKERNSLEVLLSMPVSDGTLYIGKTFAAVIPPLVSSYIAVFIFCVGAWIVVGWTISLNYLFLVLLLTAFDAFVMVSASVVVSSNTTSVRAANLMASFIIIPMSLVIQAEAILVIMSFGRVLWAILAFLVIATLILMRMGIQIFNREEILAREMDSLNLRQFFGLFKKYLRQTPVKSRDLTSISTPSSFSLIRLYREDIPQLFRLERTALFVASFIVLFGLVTGFIFAAIFPFPANSLNIHINSNADYIKMMHSFAIVPIYWSAFGLFLYNVRSFLTSWILGTFSFGSMSVIIAMANPALWAFLTGEIASSGSNPFKFFLVFIAPYSLFYIPATIISTAFVLRTAAIIMSPPKGLSPFNGFILATVEWGKVMFVVVPLLLLASLTLSYVTPFLAMTFYG